MTATHIRCLWIKRPVLHALCKVFSQSESHGRDQYRLQSVMLDPPRYQALNTANNKVVLHLSWCDCLAPERVYHGRLYRLSDIG